MTDVGSFAPAAGLVVDHTGRSTHVSGTLEAYGEDASAANAATAQATIMAYWNKVFPDGYTVTCDVTVRYRPPEQDASGVAEIEMAKLTGPSHVSRLAHNMSLNMAEADALTWTVAHELGHQLGLRDRYTESIFSVISGTFGGQRTTEAEASYEQNLMGVSGGQTESKNVSDLIAENAPSYFSDDDQIRLWVARRPVELPALSTATKVHMVDVLLNGWVSEDDMISWGVGARAVSELRFGP